MKYKVERGIIIAAGFGSRMLPVTLETPKPLVKVNNIRFIDTIIDKMVSVGIKDIYVVRGYLKEKFDELLDKYPFLHFIDNDLYNKENNISSVIKVVDLLENSYLCEADFIVSGNDVFVGEQEETNYMCTAVEETDDWCFDLDADGYLCNYRKGGKNCYQAFGISYWSKEDAKKLKKYLKKMYLKKANRQKYWEMCIFEDYKKHFKIKPNFVNRHSIKEIDSFEELVAEDQTYKEKKYEI